MVHLGREREGMLEGWGRGRVGCRHEKDRSMCALCEGMIAFAGVLVLPNKKGL